MNTFAASTVRSVCLHVAAKKSRCNRK